jgi:hypothetical protein
MPSDPGQNAVTYLAAQFTVRLARIRSGGLDRGALSLEWVAIAIVLVATALALAAFLTGKIGDLEKLIPS